MSDFDKEAEREKLRKKFARDEEKRAETQRMSELLLKGATMTNKHCEQCSDPLFRYNDQTFCPSCQATDSDATDQHVDATQQPEPNPKQTVDSTQSTEMPLNQQEPSAGEHSAERMSEPTEPAETAAGIDSSLSGLSADTESSTGVAAARHALELTITQFARRAAETDDPRRARELLAAAHEAASTLAELNRATA